MSCAGKVVGGVIGFVVGNVPGAIIGAVVGHYVIDRNATASKKTFNAGSAYTAPTASSGPSYTSANYSTLFLRNLTGMMAKLAKADGRVSQHEIVMIERFFDEALQLDSGARRAAVTMFREARDSDITFDQYAQGFKSLVGSDKNLLAVALEMLTRLASADSSISSAEDALLKQAAKIFGIAESEYNTTKRQFGTDNERHYATLGLSSKATNDEIKDRYRSLAREYHPDVVAGKGMPKDFIDYATRKFQDIQEAYSAIKTERGFR